MAQAISNKVLVDNTNYCWMVCDYSVTNTILSYTLSFHFDKGCAQLDNAWIRLGSATVWANTGRIHNYEGNLTSAHNVAIHSGTYALAEGTNSFTFGITKYNGVALSGSFTVSGTPVFTPKLYGSVNGRARKIKKLYCSVGEQTRKVKKLYASVNGAAKLIYEDGS